MAPRIFQRILERLLQGIDKYIVYIDDILNSEVIDKEHLDTLNEVFSYVENTGLQLSKDKINVYSWIFSVILGA